MHVCVIYHHHFPADFSTALNEYTRLLVDEGVEVTVIAGREERNTPAREQYHGVDVHRILTDLSTSVSVEPTRFGYRALKRVEELSATEYIDILHLRSFPNLGLVLAPVPWLDAPATVLSDVRGTAVSNRVFEGLSRGGIRLQHRLVDETAVVDEHVADRIFGDRADPAILPLGVSFERFRPDVSPVDREVWGFDEDDLLFGYTGNIHPSRDLPRLVSSLETVVEQRPDVGLVVVGDGRGRAALEQTATERGVADRVHVTGRVPFTAVPAHVTAFDVGLGFVADKAQYRHQPPLKTVEFLASGLPVLATDTPGNRRFVSQGKNGLLVRDEADAIARGMTRLIEDPARRRGLAEEARDSVREFDYERIVSDRLLPLYRRLLDTEGGMH